MASILRQIVAGPRAKHEESSLDLCYVHQDPTIIATSGPSGTYPQLAYRNPLKDLVKFLDSKHGAEWAIWEFRAEGTGYPDDEVYGRVHHYPWPDHHPPPFALIPLIMASMRNWLKGEEAQGKGRVVVVHCKAGKGRSGTISCSYLISEEGWTPEDAKQRFTDRRMRPGFGAGISIPSQIRTIQYVDRWTRFGKRYVERPAEIVEVHVWGLRDGVKISVEGYVDEGKVIKTFHTFSNKEREIVRGGIQKESGFADVVAEVMGKKKAPNDVDSASTKSTSTPEEKPDVSRSSTKTMESSEGGDVVFRPASRIVLPSSDINIDFERRNKSKFGGFAMVTSVAHVWFNIFFEGNGPEQEGVADDSGVFEMEWDAMDGIKGSSRKGTRAFDRMAIVWKAVDVSGKPGIEINEPAEGEEVAEAKPADWRGVHNETRDDDEKKLGLRADKHESANVSRASSMASRSTRKSKDLSAPDELDGVRARGPDGELKPAHSTMDLADGTQVAPDPAKGPMGPTETRERSPEQVPPQVDGLVDGTAHLSTADLPGGVPESEMDKHHGHAVGSLMKVNKHFESSS